MKKPLKCAVILEEAVPLLLLLLTLLLMLLALICGIAAIIIRFPFTFPS